MFSNAENAKLFAQKRKFKFVLLCCALSYPKYNRLIIKKFFFYIIFIVLKVSVVR